MAILQPLPVISRNVPAYTNDDFGGSFPASHANNLTYGGSDYWRCAQTPVSNANNGTLIAPVYLAYDLSSVPSAQRGQVLLVWYNDPATGAYRPDLISNNASNIATSYTIDVNPAAGGSYPSSGWVTKATISSQAAPYHSRQHAVDMTGNNWIRINVTGIVGSAVNNNCSLNMDVHDAHLGNQDNWILYGDSIAQRAFMHDDGGGLNAIIPSQINAVRPSYWPLWEGGGIGGWTSVELAANVSTFVGLFTGKYVGVCIGTNDANLGGSYITGFSGNLQTIITAILGAGKIPVIPQIPGSNTANIIANAPAMNATITSLIASNPGCIAGPDLWTYFRNNLSLISGDNIHPTDPAGYNAYRTQWVNWATANIYFNTLQTFARSAFKVRTVLSSPARTAFKVRTVLKTLARTAFKIQLSSAGPQPYRVSLSTHLVERPFSTVSSKATVVNANGVLQNSLVATVTVTYPDNTTATPQVYWLGNGKYQTTYATKGVGTLSELWVFTDSQGSSAECKNLIPCAF